MIRVKVEVNNALLEELQYRLKELGNEARVWPKTSAALADGAELIRTEWIKAALGYPMAGKYVNSIRIDPRGPFEYEILTEAKEADWIENGTKQLDMKTTHPYGRKSRVSKEVPGHPEKGGFPYLIVPFQWGTEEGTKRSGPRNIVPKQLLSLMQSRSFNLSKVNNETYLSPNQRKQMVERWTYTWGNRAKDTGISNANGMVRFEQSEVAEGKEGKRYGGYFTFRVISAKQLVTKPYSWIKPAMPARLVTKFVVQKTEKKINEIVESAIMEDIRQ